MALEVQANVDAEEIRTALIGPGEGVHRSSDRAVLHRDVLVGEVHAEHFGECVTKAHDAFEAIVVREPGTKALVWDWACIIDKARANGQVGESIFSAEPQQVCVLVITRLG